MAAQLEEIVVGADRGDAQQLGVERGKALLDVAGGRRAVRCQARLAPRRPAGGRPGLAARMRIGVDPPPQRLQVDRRHGDARACAFRQDPVECGKPLFGQHAIAQNLAGENRRGGSRRRRGGGPRPADQGAGRADPHHRKIGDFDHDGAVLVRHRHIEHRGAPRFAAAAPDMAVKLAGQPAPPDEPPIGERHVELLTRLRQQSLRGARGHVQQGGVELDVLQIPKKARRQLELKERFPAAVADRPHISPTRPEIHELLGDEAVRPFISLVAAKGEFRNVDAGRLRRR